ncbi:MAG: DUF2127 domain-containing protein [Gemmatimonadota bacterium]|nr:DUF2127 domain-containing protein [Gemmatimonadota bacterium]MDE3173572.1 DUF2127 domain-containing protein [Gemmatimonadota bacterium]MDE3215711.1 DUF2127 domain-containing protein [Gemmatimonadota bacterium]
MRQSSAASGAGAIRRAVADRLFLAGVLLKGLDGLLEIAGGVLALNVAPATITATVRFLTANELSEDPSDLVANAARRAVAHLSHDTAAFAAAYLVVNGLVKLLVVGGLLRRRAWAFPTALVLLGGFIAYQGYRVALGHSLPLAVLTLVDLGIGWAIWREYRMVRQPKVRRQEPR